MELIFRPATIDDLSDIVRMLADDFLGRQREIYEEPLPESYINAFRGIEADPNIELIVAISTSSPPYEGEGGSLLPESDSATEMLPVQSVVGTLQLTCTPSISFQGSKRATVESVRVDEKYRGRGLGRKMMLWAIDRAKQKGCVSMQLTTNSDRVNAHRFYERLGFAGTHLGMKLKLK